nr:recombinase family protein [uncultured Oscillibacter sp.]
MELYPKKVYSTIAYYRLSKNDCSTHESDSITNQRKLIQNYASTHSDIELVGEAFDDGYTGTNFNRPGFRAVMEAIESGKANCVIVKDLSRLGREYIETGKYLEMVFPDKGVRFIAINDDVDTDHRSQGDDILIPVKNIMNESQCRELSKKLREQFRLQRSQGEFVGAFASYGYCKSAEDRHKLIIDDYAAEIVRTIFSLKMQGYSQQAIADSLNKMDVLPPAEYKKSSGLRYQSGFKSTNSSAWTAMAVRKILTNSVYIGELVQGKRGTPNYKVKKMRVRRQEDWVVVEHNHEPIIDELAFQVVQKMLGRDTRTSPKDETVQLLAGLVFCPACNRAMCRRVVTRSRKKFYYYVCSTHKNGKGCSSHSIPQEKLELAVLHAIQGQIKCVVEMDALLQSVSNSDLLAVKLKRMDIMIAQKEQELDRQETFRMKLYEAMTDGLVDKEEYHQMRTKYGQKIETAQSALVELREQRKQLEEESAPSRAWMDQFLQYKNITALSREVVVTLVDKIYVYEGRRVHIDFSFRNQMMETMDLLNSVQKEAI